MPPKLKQRPAGERPPPAPKPAPAPAPEPTVSGPETVGPYDIVVVDDEPQDEPDLTIDLQDLVDRQQPKPSTEQTKQPKRRENPFLPRHRFLKKISL